MHNNHLDTHNDSDEEDDDVIKLEDDVIKKRVLKLLYKCLVYYSQDIYNNC